MLNSQLSTSRKPLYETVAERINFLIDQGTLRPGDRVPSIRKLSHQMQVSVNTVKEAYGQLEDRQIIEARPQSGFYVRPQLLEIPSDPVFNPPELLNPTDVNLNQIYHRVMRDHLNPQLLKLGISVPDCSLLPVDKLNRMLARETRRYPNQAVSYQLPPGNLRLRQQIARRMLLSGCTLSPDQIVITSGCVEAVDLSLRTLCRPGDTVAIETPFYFNFLQLIDDLGLKALEIPTSPRGGISLEALDYALSHNGDKVKACVVISNFNNPVGSSLSTVDKKRLVEILSHYQVPLIEDDIFGDLAYSGERPKVAKAFDRNDNVLLCSSFSKTLAPGYRVGWVVAGRYQDDIERRKMLTGVATASPPQLAIAEFLANGGYEHHLRSIRKRYAHQMAQMQGAIGRFFPAGTRASRPQGGFNLWVEMTSGVDAMQLYKDARKHNIGIAPGPIFSLERKYQNFIRLNAARWDKDIESAIATLGQLAAAQLV